MKNRICQSAETELPGTGCYLRHMGITTQITKNNAEILMIDDQVGTLEAGKKANIVAFKGNPDEDINMLENIQMVMKAGMVI